jgi:hypothetical protein
LILDLAALTAHAPLLDDPLQIVHDPTAWIAGWLGRAVAGNQAVDHPGWLSDLFANAFTYTGFDAPASCTGGGGNCTYYAIWHDLQASGYVVLGMALLFRLFKVVSDQRRQVGLPQFLVTDVLIRGSLAAFAINVSYIALAQLMHSSIAIGDGLFEDIMSIGWGTFSGPDGMHRASAALFSNIPPIPTLLVGIAVLYLTVLVVASRVAMIFAITVAPLLIPIYAYSGQSSLVVWWLRLVAQGLLVPVVLGAMFAVAMTVILTAESSAGATAIGPLLSPLTAIAALWFVGHSIQALLKHMFPGHSGFMSGVMTFHARTTFVRKVTG